MAEFRVEDLDGYGEAKDWALDLVKDLRDWEAGALEWQDVAPGLLLSGPTGTGKTMFAAAVARSCGAAFIATSSAQWQARGHLGDMLAAMRRSFKEAEKQAPAVLLIDEIDSIGDRGKFQGHNVDYNVQVVNALLELLDGSEGREGVVVIATTNHPEQVDPALRRPGRLDRHVVIPLPDFDTRRRIIAMHLAELELSAEELSKIAAATGGCSGAQLRKYAVDARRSARREGRRMELADIMNEVPSRRPLGEQELRIASVHEAGHAIVGTELRVADVIEIVVLRDATAGSGIHGYVQWRIDRGSLRRRQSYLDEVSMVLGGLAAERVILGEFSDGSGGGRGSDLQHATDLVTLMVASLGMGDSLAFAHASSSTELQHLRQDDPELRRQVERILSVELERACEIVSLRRNTLERVAEEIRKSEVLSGGAFMKLIDADECHA